MKFLEREVRRIWSWPERLLYWAYRFFLSPFETKVEGQIMGSMTRWAVFLFTVAEVLRLAPIWVHTPSGWIVTMVPLGWPDVAAIFVILYALGIDKAINNARPSEVLDLVGKVIPGGAAPTASQSMTAPDGSVLTQTSGQAPVAAAPKAEETQPHEWAEGDPHAGLG